MLSVIIVFAVVAVLFYGIESGNLPFSGLLSSITGLFSYIKGLFKSSSSSSSTSSSTPPSTPTPPAV